MPDIHAMLDNLDALAEKATKGEWKEEGSNVWRSVYRGELSLLCVSHNGIPLFANKEDAAYIASLHNSRAAIREYIRGLLANEYQEIMYSAAVMEVWVKILLARAGTIRITRREGK